MLATALTFLRQNKMHDIVFREITGNNIPHVAIVRNKDEFLDQSISQFGNTAAYFGSGLLLDKLFNLIPKQLKVPLKGNGLTWFHVGKSMGIFSFIAAVNLAMPFLRNYITTSRTGTTQYADMIGEKSRLKQSKAKLEQTLAGYLSRFLKTVAMGVGVSAASVALLMIPARRNASIPKWVGFLHKHIGLAEGKFRNFSDLSAVLFWVVPTFSGLLAGARDIYEMKELALRFAAFNLAFFVFPKTVEKGIDYAVKNMKPSKLWGPNKNLAYLGKFVSSLIFCSAVPTVLNIYLTRQRVKNDTRPQPVETPLKSTRPVFVSPEGSFFHNYSYQPAYPSLYGGVRR